MSDDHLLNRLRLVETPTTDDEIARLTFLREEGLPLLAAYERIKDPAKRRMVIELIKALGG